MPSGAGRAIETVALILAAGSGDRLGVGSPKAFLPLGGRPMVAWSLEAAAAAGAIDAVILVVPVGIGADVDIDAVLAPVRLRMPAEVVVGGITRSESVRAGLRAVEERVRTIVVHDAARPFASPDLFDRVVTAVHQGGATPPPGGAVPVVPSADTVKRVRNGLVLETIPRAELAMSQTPQAFRAQALRDAHQRAELGGTEATDDAMLLEDAGYAIVAIAGEASNFKITTAEDLDRAERLVAGRSTGDASSPIAVSPDEVGGAIRVGFGFDTHPFDEARILHLGGVRFDGVPGLAGHSDGDAVCHAVADALLGAAAAGDVGQHFPDTEPSLAGISGPDLLDRTLDLVEGGGFRPIGCDVTVIAERPAIGPRRDDMRRVLAAALALPLGAVSVKATRPEGLGLTGSGIGCMAVVTLLRAATPGSGPVERLTRP